MEEAFNGAVDVCWASGRLVNPTICGEYLGSRIKPDAIGKEYNVYRYVVRPTFTDREKAKPSHFMPAEARDREKLECGETAPTAEWDMSEVEQIGDAEMTEEEEVAGVFIGANTSSDEEEGKLDAVDRVKAEQAERDSTIHSVTRKGVRGWESVVECPVETFKFLIGRQGGNRREMEAKYPGLVLQFDDLTQRSSPQQQNLSQARLCGGLGKVRLFHETSKIEILRAKEEIRDKIKLSIKQLPYTHFISLPFIAAENPELISNVAKLQTWAKNNKHRILEHKVDESIIVPSGQLHFTLCMLRLCYPDEVEEVSGILEMVSKEESLKDIFRSDASTSDIGIHVNFGGLEIMNDEPRLVDVAYITEHNQANKNSVARTTIKRMCDVLFQMLIDAGYLDFEELGRQRLVDSCGNADVKLHVTLLNTKWRDALSRKMLTGMEDSVLDSRRNLQVAQHERIPVDVRKLLPDFQAEFGSGNITSLHLSRRGGAAIDTGYYVAEKIVPIRGIAHV